MAKAFNCIICRRKRDIRYLDHITNGKVSIWVCKNRKGCNQALREYNRIVHKLLTRFTDDKELPEL